jgi:Cyclin D1 binding domain
MLGAQVGGRCPCAIGLFACHAACLSNREKRASAGYRCYAGGATRGLSSVRLCVGMSVRPSVGLQVGLLICPSAWHAVDPAQICWSPGASAGSVYPPGMQNDDHLLGALHADADGRAAVDEKVVVSCFKGMGRVAGPGFQDPQWVDGRLWLYEDGDIGFLWLEEYEFLVDLSRIDDDLL